MVGFLGRRTSQQEPGDGPSKDSHDGSFQGSVEMAPATPSDVGKHSSSKQEPNNKKKAKGWISGLLHRNGGNDHEEESHGGSSHDNDSSHSGSRAAANDDDDDASRHSGTSVAQSAKVVETFPDSENEFHEVIRNQNWDLLEILLKEYDFKKYIKPKEVTKPGRKLRVAKYLPEIGWKKEVEVPPSPLYGLDALGRAPLHLCCATPCPDKPLLRLLFCARDLASVPDATGSLPIHLAVTHEKSVEVVDKLIRGYYQGSMETDATGRTPLMWATEIIRRHDDQLDGAAKLPSNRTYWAHPATREAVVWHAKQGELWQLVKFMLENRIVRRQKLVPREYRQVVKAMSLAAPSDVVSLFLALGEAAMKKEINAGPALSICITRQYPLDLLEKVIDSSPKDFAKDHKDNTGRGVVAAHYRIGCIAHPDSLDENSKRQSFRMTMQSLANAVGNLEEKVTPSKEYTEWWEKLKYLINLWGSYTPEDDASHDDFDPDDLLLHNALSNPDIPPSLIRLLTSLRPQATDLEHPKTTALPIHLACRVWRFKQYPPRRGEKESHMDKVVVQLLEGDFTRTRKRYRNRLPIHHAVAAGKSWQFVKPLVVHDRKSLQVRDPLTKLYPFQLAASTVMGREAEALTRYKFTSAEWNTMKEREKARQISAVENYYHRERLSLIYQLLKHLPHAVSHDSIMQEEAARSAARPKRMIVMEGLHATEEVALAAQMQMIRGMFGLSSVSGHFIAWAYENTRRGWKTHRSNFGVLKEAIMDGFIPMSMDKFWRKLKFWIWQECPWESPAIPRRDDFLLHGAMCNPNISPWIIDLLLECFPRSASIPLPASDGCYPLHIACVTDRYVPLPFEFANKRTVIEMTAKAYPDGALLKWKNRLPLHLAIVHSKDWDEIRYLAEEEPLALSVPDPKLGFFPFQLMALNRPYTTKQRSRFEMIARTEVGKEEWRSLSAHDKVVHMSRVLEQHEIGALGGVFELLKRNPVLLSVAMADNESSGSRSLSSSGEEFVVMTKTGNISSSGSDWMKASTQSLSLASIDFLEDVFEKDNMKAIERKNREESRSSRSLLDDSISDPFLGSSFRMPPKPDDLSNSLQPDQSLSGSSQEPHTVPPLSNDDEEFEYIEYIIEDEEGEDEYVEISGVDERSLNTGKNNSTLPRLAENRTLNLGPYDHEALCYPRRKDVIFIRKASAHVVWRNETLQPGTLKNSSRRSYWAKILQQMGEEIDIGEVYTIRHEKNQSFLASTVVEGMTIFIDEDESYVWVLCGEDACSAAENYDIEAAIIITSSLLDEDTGVWLDAFRSAPQIEELSGPGSPHRVLEWILRTAEKAPQVSESKRFTITRTMLRSAFAHVITNASDAAAEQIIMKSTRKIWFDVAKQKMEAKMNKRRFIGIRYFVARRAAFARQRLHFYENQKRIKFLKKLKKKQRHAARRATSSKTESSSSMFGQSLTDENVIEVKTGGYMSKFGTAMQPSGHLDALHQPSPHSDDDVSIGSKALFEPPRQTPPEKPMVAAALKAKEARDRSHFEASQNASAILNTLNQPNDIHGEDASLGSDALFEEPRGPPPKKPLVAAALKAKKAAEGRSGRHLLQLHQPKMDNDDSGSLGSDDLFDEPRGPPPKKPLLAAALKAKKQAEGRSGRHLLQLHQPIYSTGDTDDSIASDDLFDPPRGPPPEKPMLAAALKAKQKAEEEKLVAAQESTIKPSAMRRRARRSHPKHLKGIHQPHAIEEDDNGSLAASDVFDPPKGPPPRKPLLAAALKAKEQRDKSTALHSRPNNRYGPAPSHLHTVHQPTVYEDDELSLAMGAVFDLPKAPPPPKPLLAAALKAKEQRDKLTALHSRPNNRYGPAPSHLHTVHQPTVYEDDELSLAMGAVFDPPKAPPPPKPLLAAALKAKEQRDKLTALHSRPNNRYGPAPSHLHTVHQPTVYEDDELSLAMGAVFDPPKAPPPPKPLLAAALKAKEDRDKGIFRSPQRTRSILKPSHFLQSPEPIDISEGSMTMGDIYLTTPKRTPGSPRKEGSAVRKPVPMTANMIRMNSVERLHLGDSIPGEIETKSPAPGQKHGLDKTKVRRRSSASAPSKGPSSSPQKRPARRGSKPGERKPPEKKKSGIMSLLGRRQT